MYMTFLILVTRSIVYIALGAGIGYLLALAATFFGEEKERILRDTILLLGFAMAIILGPFALLGLYYVYYNKGLLSIWHLPFVLVPYFITIPISWQNNHIVTFGISILVTVVFCRLV